LGEDAPHAGAASHFPVDVFQAVGGVQAYPVRCGEVEHRQAFRDGNFGPFGQFRVFLAPGFQGRRKPYFSALWHRNCLHSVYMKKPA
jgi:hypothetical protein